MGTYYYIYLKSDYETINYYFDNRPYNKLFDVDKHDLLSSVRIKIGKNSIGWKFCLYIYPKYNINSFDDWITIFNNDKIIIVNEYDEIISSNEMVRIISKKERAYPQEDNGKIIDNEYIISEVGLLQHSIQGFKVVKNETYDYFICNDGLFNN